LDRLTHHPGNDEPRWTCLYTHQGASEKTDADSWKLKVPHTPRLLRNVVALRRKRAAQEDQRTSI
jgi:hypothetical protein